jgi:hypothetical protein
MGKRRARRTRSDEGGRRYNVDDGYVVEQFQHGQYTFEGQLERLRAFALGVRRATGWRRWPGYVLLVVPLTFFLAGVVLAIVRLFA